MKNLVYKLKRPYHFFKTGLLGGWRAEMRYRFPQKKLKIITVTGTDGKTTTATLIYQMLRSGGYKVGLISTVAAYIGHKKIDTGFHVTSPHPSQLYRLMRQMVKEGIEYLVLEVTSQGAYQYRTWGIKAAIAGLTNIDYEHLDYHLTQENYLQAKMLVLNSAKKVVINQDQEIFNQVKKSLHKNIKLITFSKTTRFGANVEKALRAAFSEDYNRLNGILALTIAKQVGVADKDLAAALENFQLPEGRMEILPTTLPLTMIVDFAHTPQALSGALPNIRRNFVKKGKLIGIVGCAGLRDRLKRPKMGKIMAQYCDLAIFTAEDPRSENVWSIINQMKSDLGDNYGKVISIPNREQALQFALENFGKDDNVIAIFGKGHEQSMNYDGKTEILWNDITGAKKILAKLEKLPHA
ncbi:MAG: UDP-N-acetylmuramyl-tripeptide synthetase [bacterium]|nr:UDP-N-acetylmuramyl-tripeptide synthetase [bacterium]